MEEEIVLSHRARVMRPSEERLTKLRSLLEDRVSESDAYLWDAEISNTLLDSHFTHMSESTLRNYAEDANRGVAFLRGHNWRELPVGYSIEATIVNESGRQSVIAGFYTVRGIADTDDLIKRMESKILRDVSVGFHGGRAICDLCGQDFWDCRHFPGLKYETKEGDVVKTELATFTIEDARLSEVSGVFDGSTPEAMIRKAHDHAFRGLLDPKQIEVLEERYRTRLATRHSVSVVRDMGNLGPIPKERKMDEKQREKVVGILIDNALLKEEQRITATDEELVSGVVRMAARLATLEPQAKDGIQYRADMIAAAHLEGVRAYGNDYDKELYDKTLSVSPIETIKRFTADWKKVADTVLPAGRRSEESTQTSSPAVPALVPDAAFQ